MKRYSKESLGKNTGLIVVSALCCKILERERTSFGALKSSCSDHKHTVLQKYKSKTKQDVPKVYDNFSVVAAF